MKRNKIFVVLALSLTVLFSCQKADINEAILQPSKTLNEKAKTWFEAQPGVLNYHQVLLESKLIKIPQKIDWERSEYFTESNTIITPVSITSANGNLPLIKYWVTNIDEEGNVIDGNFYIVLYDRKKSKLSENQIIKPGLIKLQNIPNDFTGAIIKYDLENRIILSRHYDLGTQSNKTDAITVRKSKSQIPVENVAPLDEGCSYVTIDWYWQTWIDGVLVYEEYVFSTNEIVCGTGGGGGGGGSGGTLTCEQQNENFVNQGGAFSGPLTTTDDFNNGTTWIKSYNWPIYKAGTWSLFSYERGTLELKTYPRNVQRWEFQSFQHLQISEVGVNIGGTRTFTDLGATINITPTGLSVFEQVDFSVSSRVICYPLPALTLAYNSTKSFVAPNTVVILPPE